LTVHIVAKIREIELLQFHQKGKTAKHK